MCLITEQLNTKDFLIEQQSNGNWKIRCQNCKAVWSWPKETLSMGAHLKLLDHIAMHDETE